MKTKLLKASKEFVVGKHDIAWLSSSFTKLFIDMVYGPRPMPYFKKLNRSMTDKEIELELKPGECDLGDLNAFLDKAPQECRNGYANIFYIRDATGQLWAVYTYWRADFGGWCLFAYSVEFPGRWYADRRVVSR